MKLRTFAGVFIMLLCAKLGSFYRNGRNECQKTVTTASGTKAPKSFCAGDLIFDEEFNEFDLGVWKHDNTLSGGGNWEFQWYTNNRSNSYAKDGILYIKPTLTSDVIGEENLSRMTLDINGGNPADYCTDARSWGCSRTGTNQNILNPIRSAKIRTTESFSFKYGRVEVKAKMPTGDWLWPALWLLPQYNSYGTWPASGEIDLIEGRGNEHLTENGINIGTERIAPTLHWGPDSGHNAYPKTTYPFNREGDGFNKNFSLYEMEWTPDSIKFSVDGTELGEVKINSSFWDIGEFNQTGMDNPWKYGTKMAPFDKEFHLIINLAVGGTSFFPDNAVNPDPKPWLNKSPTAARDFWNGRKDWLKTWKLDENDGEDASFQVDYVKVWAL